MRLLIVEDDPDISKALAAILERNNYSIDVLAAGTEVSDYVATGNYDGIILDLMLPGMDGLEVLQQLRQSNFSLPVLLLTARSEVEDRVNGLDAGADDYLSKPFAVTELLARVRAMLRRKGDFTPDLLKFSGATLNRCTFELEYECTSFRLVNREFQMLELLLSHPGQIISTASFLEKIWGWDSEVDVSIVWVYISNLRKKISALNAPIEIRAIRGVGYCLEEKHD